MLQVSFLRGELYSKPQTTAVPMMDGPLVQIEKTLSLCCRDRTQTLHVEAGGQKTFNQIVPMFLIFTYIIILLLS